MCSKPARRNSILFCLVQFHSAAVIATLRGAELMHPSRETHGTRHCRVLPFYGAPQCVIMVFRVGSQGWSDQRIGGGERPRRERGIAIDPSTPFHPLACRRVPSMHTDVNSFGKTQNMTCGRSRCCHCPDQNAPVPPPEQFGGDFSFLPTCFPARTPAGSASRTSSGRPKPVCNNPAERGSASVRDADATSGADPVAGRHHYVTGNHTAVRAGVSEPRVAAISRDACRAKRTRIYQIDSETSPASLEE